MSIAPKLAALIFELSEIQVEIRAYVEQFAELESQCDAARRPSVRNLLSYLVLRRRDLRTLQAQLAQLGLSSLGRAEAHVCYTLNAVVRALQALAGKPCLAAHVEELGDVVDCELGPMLLRQNTRDLLGPEPPERSTRIMVTMPSEAADEPEIIFELLKNGMNCLRINCAHDGPDAWLRMIANLRRAEQKLGKGCRVCMDLAGPKLRTGPLNPLPGVLKLRPERDAWGRVLVPARIFLTSGAPRASDSTGERVELALQNAEWLPQTHPGDWLSFRDARDSRRKLIVTEVVPGGVWAETEKTCYFVEGLQLFWHAADGREPERSATVASLPPLEAALTLQCDEELLLTRRLDPGHAAVLNESGKTVAPGCIGCTLPEVFDQVQVGDRIALDDGKFSGVVTQVGNDVLHIRLTQVPPSGAKLRSDKGINLPDTQLDVSPLTPKDLEDLKFVVQHADMVAYSFASRASDVRRLRAEIARIGSQSPAIVLKIETKRGFENLPAMLLESLQSSSCGVMIARGDLAVECGFERLAEIQEEILWICEAAHVPVIWATQVLENLAKSGLPSRAEITDAAMGHQAECVMLNKGPQIVKALQTLDDILQRMQDHHTKKSSLLRELQLAHGLSAETL